VVIKGDFCIYDVVVGLCVAHQTTLHLRFWARKGTAMKLTPGHLVAYCELLLCKSLVALFCVTCFVHKHCNYCTVVLSFGIDC